MCEFFSVRASTARWRWWSSLSIFAMLAFLVVAPARAQVVAQYDFENGTQGWTGFFNASVQVSTAAAQSGSSSLLTTTNSSGAGGPSIMLNSLLLPGATYQITGYVMLTNGEAATNANFTIARSDPSCSGGTCYDTIGAYQVLVTDSGWALIGGSYKVSTTATALLLYAQLVGPTSTQSFYLDNVVITETAPPPGGTPIATYTFADGGLDGWQPFGNVSLTNSVPPFPDPNADARSLLVANRTATYMGPSLSLLSVDNIVAGATYQVSLYVLLAAPDSSNPTVTISTKRTDCASPSGTYANLVTSGPLSSTAWTKVQGTLTFSNVPGAPTSLVLYIQSTSASDSFYISDVLIGELAPPPPNPSQQDNSGITSTFEDGGLDAWSSRSGSSTLTNSAAEAHSGTHSLYVTGRIANWDGPQVNVSNKMYNGSRYDVSVWVMLQPTDGSSHVLNVSLQTTLAGNTSYPGVTGYPGVTVLADGSWHQISVPAYNMANSYDPGAAYLYVQTVSSSGNDLVSFYVDDFQLTYIAPPTIQTNIPSIFETLSSDFPVGAAVDPTDVSGPHSQLLTKHFDSITSGNDMKWSSVENTKGIYNFGNADTQVGVAVCNNMRVRGHNLVWATGAQTPSYAFGDGTNSPANQATVTANIQEHIQAEVTHFGDKVYAWDVVNEPLDPSQPDCLNHGPFYNVLGKSYIDIALLAAREYAPAGTRLFINDYSTTDPARLACLVRVVQDLKERGIPIDSVGHEMHININYPTPDAVEDAIRTVAKLGVDQQITEFDMSVYNAGDNTSNYGANGGNVPLSIIAQQGYLYEHYFRVFRRLRHHLSGVTLWGMADDDTWLDSFPISRLNLPLPFDTELRAKPAYWGIVDPARLPGHDLTFSITSKTGPRIARVWMVTATNPGPGTAYAVQINGFDLKQLGVPAQCRPVVTPPSAFPLVLADIPEGSSAEVSLTINFDTHCRHETTFVVKMPWSAANGADSHTLVLWDQHP
ncbi:MAG: endo-1,4-beta-xylanase [Candidatus Acidiferrum sp.]